MHTEKIIIKTSRTAYSTKQVERTLTLGELIAYLQDCGSDDTPVYLSFDDGYTFGGIRPDDIEVRENTEGEEEK